MRKIIGLAGWSNSGKKTAGEIFSRAGYELINYQGLLNDLFTPGAEGYRQIINYFGEDFLLKSGKLNQRKLWKFVYADQHKLKILDFLLQPLLIDKCQKIIDSSNSENFLIEMLAFVDPNWNKLLNMKVWIDRNPNFSLDSFASYFHLPVRNVLEIQKKLYPKPIDDYILLSNDSSVSQLEKQIIELFNGIIGTNC